METSCGGWVVVTVALVPSHGAEGTDFTLFFRGFWVTSLLPHCLSPSQPNPLELFVDVWMDYRRNVLSKAVTHSELGLRHVGASEFLLPRPVRNPSAVLACHQP